MVKWDQLSEQERWALVYFVVEFAAPPRRRNDAWGIEHSA